MIYKGLFLGLCTVDIQYFVDEFPRSNQKTKTDTPDILVGGPATNAAVAFSALNNGAHLLSVVGEGAFSSFIFEDFKANNFDFTDIGNASTKPVIASVVTASNGDRNIFTHHPEVQDLDFDVANLLDRIRPEIIMMDGFYPEVAIPLAKEAASRNIPIVLDCGSWKPQYEELLKYSETAICSADFMPPSCDQPEDVFEFLKKYGVKNRAITRGGESILFESNEFGSEIEIEKTEVVDTLGAGDFIHGAFCFYSLKSNDFEEALISASRLASFTCKYKGTRLWLNQKSTMFFI